MICDQCETVAHCMKHGCVPKQSAPAQEPVAWMHTMIDDVVIGHRPADLNVHPDRWMPLYKDPTPCQTCEALARTVMMDQTAHDTTPPAAQPAPVQEPVAWMPYLSDRADGVQGHYAIARWNPRGYREVWNLRRHAWGAFSDDVMSLEEADYFLQQITIPTRKPTPPAAQPAVPDAIGPNEDELPAYAAGWNDCRQAMLEMMK